MSLSDLVGNAGLSGYATVAMILFMAAFAAIVVRTFLPGRRAEMDAMSRLPLDDERKGAARPGANR